MKKYRAGDEVIFETMARVVEAEGETIRIAFGDIEIDADVNNLLMVKRSVHERDPIEHLGRKGVVVQLLSEGVYLINIFGETGAAAYKVVAKDEIVHDESQSDAVSESAVAPVAPAPVAPAPAPAPAATTAPSADVGERPVHTEKTTGSDEPANPEKTDNDVVDNGQRDEVRKGDETGKQDDTLELDNPIDPIDGASANSVASMAASLAGIMERTTERRPTLDLDSIGQTERVADVTASAGPSPRQDG